MSRELVLGQTEGDLEFSFDNPLLSNGPVSPTSGHNSWEGIMATLSDVVATEQRKCRSETPISRTRRGDMRVVFAGFVRIRIGLGT
jgi:hypothetical protein